MATVVLYTSRDPRRLLEHAAEGFLQRPGAEPFPTPAYWLILRQGGLRDDLLSLAATRGVRGWFDPPLALIQELPDLLCDFEREAVGDFERVVLVGRALRESAGRAFGRIRDIDAYADAVDRWIGELMAEGIAAADVAAVHRRSGGDEFDRSRDAELLKTWNRYVELLAEAERRDPRARLMDCAAAVRRGGSGMSARLGGRRELRLVGLSDPRGGWPALLGALQDCPELDRVAVYSSERLDFVADIADDIVDLDAVPHFTAGLFAGDEPSAGSVPAGDAASTTPSISMLSAPDLPREVEEIAARVRRLLDEGVPAHRIAVASRSARPYGEHVMRALGRVGVPATARVRHPLPAVPAVRSLLALFHVAASGWERLGLVELAETPHFRARLDAGVLNHVGYQRRVRGLASWRKALTDLVDAAVTRERRLEENPDDEEMRRQPLPAAARVERALAGFQEFAAHAVALDEPRTIGGWLEWLTQFVADDPWQLQRAIYRAPGARLSAVRTDLAGWRGLQRVLTEWGAAEGRWGGGEVVDIRAFDARLRSMLGGDVALFTPVRRGVQVLEGLAAAFRSFDHVFIPGLDAARMPLRSPHSPLLDEHERAALREAGLHMDTRVQWEERERVLFRNMLATATTSLTLSYARYDETGAEQLPSAFLEEVQDAFGLELELLPGSQAFTPGVPLAADAAALKHGTHAAAIELLRATGTTTPYSGLIEDVAMIAWLATELGESRVWSPTQIEAYAKCPWAYFSGRLLRLEKLEDPDLDIDPLTRGSILHDALHRFYREARSRTNKPVYLRAVDLEWAVPLAERAIVEAIDHARTSMWVGHPALEAQKLSELRRQLVSYVKWEAEENESAQSRTKRSLYPLVRTGVDDFEVPFDDVALEIGGVRVRFRGFIDRVETSVDERAGSQHLVAAVDYKSSVWSTPAGGEAKGWVDGVVLQVPLYAYALTQIREGSAAARVEYRAIRTPKRVHSLPLYRYDGDTLVADDNAMEKYENALKDVARHISAARGGSFAADPPPSCNCPPFCHARDICRIPGGPRSNR
ncbi:hypothetical protein BH23GEM9_BH23GEM9_17450 [soil metagenome]